MKIKNITSIIATAIIIFSACKKNSDPSSQQPTITPVATAVGTPDGTAVSQNIGSSGGSIASSDGTMEIVIPSGALSANTNISIQPITNNTPNGRGKAYRCLPDGTTFAKNITIKFHYTADDLALTSPEYMLVAFQNADHYWQVVDNVSNDVAGKTVSVNVNHFTDFSAFDVLHIDPANLYLKPGESGNLKVSVAGMDITNTVVLIGEILDKPGVWKVDGITGGNNVSGTIKPDAGGTIATYTAPSLVPSKNPVTISAEFNIPFSVNGQRFNKGILVANAFIGGSKYHVLIEAAITTQIGTLDKWKMTDKASFDIAFGPTGSKIDNLENSNATLTLVTPGGAGCTSSVNAAGTGGINLAARDYANSITFPGNPAQITLAYNGGVPNITWPQFHISCTGNTPADQEIPFTTPGPGTITFPDDGKQHVIDMSQPSAGTILTYTFTPVK